MPSLLESSWYGHQECLSLHMPSSQGLREGPGLSLPKPTSVKRGQVEIWETNEKALAAWHQHSKIRLDLFPPPPLVTWIYAFCSDLPVPWGVQRLRVNLGLVESDVLTTRHIGQINDKHRAHIKTKKALCYIEKNKKTTGTVLLKKTPQDTLSKLIPKEK